ncbi:hypothetical protein ScPMuIL_001647 [Solemya velum]
MTNRDESGTLRMRKITKPVISSDVMGNRNVEVRAVGAWVQCETAQLHSEAVLSAEVEENRLRLIQQAKAKSLRRFQDDVKRRVQAIDRAKRQQMTDKSYRILEHERRVVDQSAFPSDVPTPRKDNCIMIAESQLAMRGATPSVPHGGKSGGSEEMSHAQFHSQTDKIHQFTNQARKRLGSRQILSEECIHDDLPGGMWKVSRTRDHPISRSSFYSEKDEDDISEKMDDIKLDEGLCYTSFFMGIFPSEFENACCIVIVETGDEKENQSRVKMVQFDLESDHMEKQREGIQTKAPEMSGTDINRNIPIVKVPNIYAGVQCEEEKQRQKTQHAMFRRLFMDIEREQVKENIRRKEHRKRIQRLKKNKEDERQKVEYMSQELVAPRDPVTGETPGQLVAREKEERKFVKETMREYENRRKRSKEIERYLLALRHQLKEKVGIRGIELPPLCCCGETVWDTNPETCANNCTFYKNPKGYARALQALLMSSELA